MRPALLLSLLEDVAQFLRVLDSGRRLVRWKWLVN